MKSESTTHRRSRKETWLLLGTVAVSFGVLLLLAQFRFPTEPVRQTPPPPPMSLERLAARATYDELAAIVAQLEDRVGNSVIVLQMAVSENHPTGGPFDTLKPPGVRAQFTRYIPAVRVGDDIALGLIEPHARIQRVVGRDDGEPVILASDPVRGLALVRVPPFPGAAIRMSGQTAALKTPCYVAIAEGTRGGPAMRPLFLGRTDPDTDPRWEEPLLALGGTPQTQPGSPVFSLDGRFIGMCVLQQGLPAVVPAAALAGPIERLMRGNVEPGYIGVEVQTLTTALMTATRVPQGVIVSFVDPRGPAAGRLSVGDVVDALNDKPLYSPEDLLITIAQIDPGTPITLAVTRLGERFMVPLEVRAYSASGADVSDGLGLAMRSVPQVGTEVAGVIPDTAASRAGLRAGDFITHIHDTERPTPRQVERLYAAAPPGTVLVVGIRRQVEHLVLALEKP